jgi:hypothetical protein
MQIMHFKGVSICNTFSYFVFYLRFTLELFKCFYYIKFTLYEEAIVYCHPLPGIRNLFM